MERSGQTMLLELEETAIPSPAASKTVLWLATAALASGVLMGLEMAAFRLYAPYFGYSVYVWGSMIAVVMAALAAGYAVGGRLADRVAPETALYCAVLASAASQLAALYAARPILPDLAAGGEFLGAGAATLLFFAPSMLALAASGPPIVRLCSLAGSVGSAAGKVYAISAAGSLAGIVATSFALLPRIGTHATLKALCAVSFALAGAGLIARLRYPIVAIVVALAILCAPDLGWGDNAIWTSESAYNLIRVVRQGTRTMLLLNHRTSVHTVHEEAGPWTGYYYDYFALGPLLVHAERALVLGMGAGASIHAMRTAAPGITVDAVEIDAKVVEAADRFFGIHPADPRLHVYIADARPWLLRNRGSYGLVQVDLYQGGPYVPFYLITEEFFRLVRSHMSQDGLLMMNLFDAGAAQELLASTVATLDRAFPEVVVIRGSNGNFILMALVAPQSIDALRARAARAPVTEDLREMARAALASAYGSSPAPGTPIFTDDHAPVEDMTRRMLAEYRRTP